MRRPRLTQEALGARAKLKPEEVALLTEFGNTVGDAALRFRQRLEALGYSERTAKKAVMIRFLGEAGARAALLGWDAATFGQEAEQLFSLAFTTAPQNSGSGGGPVGVDSVASETSSGPGTSSR